MQEQPTRAAYRTALIIILIATVMASTFVASYALALGRPEPRRVPVGVVGAPAREPALVEALQEVAGGGLRFRPYASMPAAEAAIERQQLSAVLVLSSSRPELLVSSASGASTAQVLQHLVAQVNEQLAPGSAPLLQVVDIHPLPRSDPLGLNSFYVTIAATVLGFVTMFQLRQHAPGLSLRDWLAAIAVLTAVGGFALALVTNRLLRALPGPFLEHWATLSAQIAVAALFNSTMIVLLGRWAIIPTWLMFIAFGNAWSGGAVAPPLLPRVYAFVGHYMPTGATVRLIHSAAYFRHTQPVRPFVVQACWLIGCLSALLISTGVKRRSPTDR